MYHVMSRRWRERWEERERRVGPHGRARVNDGTGECARVCVCGPVCPFSAVNGAGSDVSFVRAAHDQAARIHLGRWELSLSARLHGS